MKRPLRIGDLAELTEVPVHTLRYWLRIGALTASGGARKGSWLGFSDDELARAKALKRAQEGGYEVANIAKQPTAHLLKLPITTKHAGNVLEQALNDGRVDVIRHEFKKHFGGSWEILKRCYDGGLLGKLFDEKKVH